MAKKKSDTRPPPNLAVVDDALPDLVVMATNPHETANALVAHLKPAKVLFRRDDHLVRIVTPDDGGPASVKTASVASIVDLAHRHTRPVQRVKGDDGHQLQRTRLPPIVAGIVQERLGEFPRWRSFTLAPFLKADGSIRVLDGYDIESGLYGLDPVDVDVPPDPVDEDAKAALLRLRCRFATFPFADSPTVPGAGGVNLVDILKPPGADESAFFAGLLSAVAAPSLDFVPGLVVNAASLSGAGSGKSLLMQAAARIAHGSAIPSVSATKVAEELEKKLTTTLMRGHAMLFVQNYNAKVLQSDLLASAITDRPFDLRKFGTTEGITIDATIFFGCTGNAITIGEDMVRRVLKCNLDAKMDDPETRQFAPGFLDSISADRADILSDVLTIWRWGRQHPDLPRGRPSGSFERWAEQVRDPLLALGCQDVVARQSELKGRDPGRQATATIFEMWWEKHNSEVIKAKDIHDAICELVDSGKKSRQRVAAYFINLDGTQQGGYRFNVIRAEGKWSPNINSRGSMRRPTSLRRPPAPLPPHPPRKESGAASATTTIRHSMPCARNAARGGA
jgi:putative DNA primase/helicase